MREKNGFWDNVLHFLKEWTLPVAMIAGTVIYFIFALTPALDGMATVMGPIIDELADEYNGRAVIAKMNVDEPGVGDICARFGITNIPNMKLFKNGVEVGNVVGAVPKATVKGVIDRNL